MIPLRIVIIKSAIACSPFPLTHHFHTKLWICANDDTSFYINSSPFLFFKHSEVLVPLSNLLHSFYYLTKALPFTASNIQKMVLIWHRFCWYELYSISLRANLNVINQTIFIYLHVYFIKKLKPTNVKRKETLQKLTY